MLNETQELTQLLWSFATAGHCPDIRTGPKLVGKMCCVAES